MAGPDHYQVCRYGAWYRYATTITSDNEGKSTKCG
jgi:hypothetical protein